MPRAVASRTKPATTIREVTLPTDTALAGAYGLLRMSFSPGDRVSQKEWVATLRERAHNVWSDYVWHLVIAERRGRVIGLATGTYLGSVNVGIIGYLAIDGRRRAKGLGTRLRARLRDAFRRDAVRITGRDLAGILGEVSAKNPWLHSLARRPAVLVLNTPYYQPKLSPGDAASPFLLYYESIGRIRRSLPAGEVRRILYAIWRRSYRVSRPLDAPAFRLMMRALAGRSRIGPHPDHRYQRP